MRYRLAPRRKALHFNQGATLAQLVERLIRNQQVAGSIPAGGSISSKNTPAILGIPTVSD